MKSFKAAATLLLLSSVSAAAADLPSRKAPVIAPPPPPMWTGFYAGLNIGYGFGTSNGSYTTAYPISDGWDNAQSTARGTLSFADNGQGILLGNAGNAAMT